MVIRNSLLMYSKVPNLMFRYICKHYSVLFNNGDKLIHVFSLMSRTVLRHAVHATYNILIYGNEVDSNKYLQYM